VPHGAAVALTVVLAFSAIGGVGYVLALQVTTLATDLPKYEGTIKRKIREVRRAGKGGPIEKAQSTVKEVIGELQKDDDAKARKPAPVVVERETPTGLAGLRESLGGLAAALATAGLVVVLVIFMLIEREELRNRIVGVFGSGTLAVTTRAIDEAARRVSRYLSMQGLVNLIFGIGVAIGLMVIGVPYALLWAVLAGALRFIPYVGPFIGAGAPIVVSLAVLPGWAPGLYVVALFILLELFTNLVLETYLYAGAAGVSQVALLIAVAFWSWLWGPIGLLLATPLTVCLVVLGKHVSGFSAIATLMADAPALEPPVHCYQRLLAHDDEEGKVYELDPRRGTIIKSFTIGNGPKKDFEAITIAGDDIYMLVSDGVLYRFREGANNSRVKYQVIDTHLGKECEFEGLAFDSTLNSLLLACKNVGTKHLKDSLVIYRWRLDGKGHRLSMLTVPLSRILPSIGEKDLHPSDITVDPLTGNYVLVASIERAIFEITPTGDVVFARKLPGDHEQAESVAITPDSILIVGDEAKHHPAVITLYPWP